MSRRNWQFAIVVRDLFGFHEVAVGLGLGLITYGLWLHWPWLAWVVLGSLLFLVGVVGALRRPYRPRDIGKVLRND